MSYSYIFQEGDIVNLSPKWNNCSWYRTDDMIFVKKYCESKVIHGASPNDMATVKLLENGEWKYLNFHYSFIQLNIHVARKKKLKDILK